jgi:hypothetical protein
VATHTTTLFGGIYASNLFSTTDATPGTLNAFGYFDDFSVAAVALSVPCAADFNHDATRDALDLAGAESGTGMIRVEIRIGDRHDMGQARAWANRGQA